jgi:uncharacterized membrane protein YuzA (DUF378 family)
LLLPGVIIAAVTGGSVGAIAALAIGHPPMLVLVFYSLTGCCAVLAYLWQAMAIRQNSGAA